MIENLDTIGGLAVAVVILYTQQRAIWKRLSRVEDRLMNLEFNLKLHFRDDEK